MWKIKRILDRGPKEHYRYHVSGENLFNEIPTNFHWSVPDLRDYRYFLADDADERSRQIWANRPPPATDDN